MKHKLGPLPVWAWIAIAGSTVAIAWYLRRSASAAAQTPQDAFSVPQTAGAGETVSDGGGGGTIADSLPTAHNNDDIYSELLNLEGTVATLPGTGGVQDAPAATTTFAGELQDVSTVADLFKGLGFFAPAATAAKAEPAKKKANGSGNAGAVRNTAKGNPRAGQTFHVERHNGKVEHIYDNGKVVVVKPGHSTQVHSGGNQQPQRTTKPKPAAKPKPKPKKKPKAKPSGGIRGGGTI